MSSEDVLMYCAIAATIFLGFIAHYAQKVVEVLAVIEIAIRNRRD